MKFKILITIIAIQFSCFGQNHLSNEEVLIMNDSIQLPGTLTYDSSLDKQPLVIFVHGSGNVDRNGNQAGLPANAAYIKQLSDSLTTKGIAFYRYDKRTATMANLKYLMKEVNFDSFVSDLRLAIDKFKNDERFSSITLIGHSQGSLVAMLASTSDIDKYISLAGPSQSIDTTILGQLQSMYPNLVEPATRYFKELKETGTIKEIKEPILQQIFPKQNQAFFASWMQYDPTEEIKKVSVPILILNGTKDLQVSVDDAKNLHAAQPDSKLVIIDNMNHVLKTIEKDEENVASYATPDFPLSAQLISTIEDFIKN